MTVGTKLHQCLNNIESAKTELKNYSMETQDKNAQQQFSQFANQLTQVEQGLRQRVNYIEQQEPQYKVYKQQQQQQKQ